MQFNPELMRAILLKFESIPAGDIFNGRIQIEGFSQADTNETAKVLLEEGYFDGIPGGENQYGMLTIFVCRHLNMKAHQFLANVRNNTVWKKVLAKAKADGGSTSISILSALAEAFAKKYVGLE